MMTTAISDDRETKTHDSLIKNLRANHRNRSVGVFLHHRDAKVALEDLRDAGFPLSWVKLMSRNCWRYDWLAGLDTCDRFDGKFFNTSDKYWQFFQRLFFRGKYLIAIEAPPNSLRCAEAILSRRRGHGEVWHL